MAPVIILLVVKVVDTGSTADPEHDAVRTSVYDVSSASVAFVESLVSVVVPESTGSAVVSVPRKTSHEYESFDTPADQLKSAEPSWKVVGVAVNA